MNKAELLHLIASNKRLFVLFFCVLFGVITSESYAILKQKKGARFRHILPKLVVALFVCALCTPVIDGFKLNDKFYPYVIMLAACVSMPLLDWLILELIPSFLYTCKTVLINVLTKGKDLKREKKEEKDDAK